MASFNAIESDPAIDSLTLERASAPPKGGRMNPKTIEQLQSLRLSNYKTANRSI